MNTECKIANTIYLAVDMQEGSLVTSSEFNHWADAYLSAISNNKAEFKRDEDGYMRPEINGESVYMGGSFDDDDDVAKDEAGRELIKHMNTHGGGRYDSVEITVDADGFLVCGSGENELLDAVTYGRAAGYKLRRADAERADCRRFGELDHDEE